MSAAAGGTPPVAGSGAPIGLVVMNLGGPSSLDDVEPFLRRAYRDPLHRSSYFISSETISPLAEITSRPTRFSTTSSMRSAMRRSRCISA